MAMPIEPTPVLKGKDAERLLQSMERNKYDKKRDDFIKNSVLVFKSTESRYFPNPPKRNQSA